MAKKRKPPAKRKSGARGRWRKRAFFGLLRSGKRGRPKGETHQRKMIQLDVLWLEAGAVLNENWSDKTIVNELLLDDPTRWEKYKLGKCEYRDVYEETLRRYVAAVRNK